MKPLNPGWVHPINESLRTDTRYWPLTVSEQDIIEHRADLFDAVSYLMLSSSQIVMTGQS